MPPSSAPQPKERVEYRICGEEAREGGVAWQGAPRTYDLKTIERSAAELSRRNKNVRIQSRVVTESPWEDVADA